MLLGIDPSIRALGWAMLDYDFDYHASGVIRSPKGGDWMDALDWTVNELLNALEDEPCITDCIIELPESYSSTKGNAAANSQAIVKLTGVAFSCRQAVIMGAGELGVHVAMVTPKRWKGQCPKEVTQKRVNRKYGCAIKDHNESDALGLCDYYERHIAIREADNDD